MLHHHESWTHLDSWVHPKPVEKLLFLCSEYTPTACRYNHHFIRFSICLSIYSCFCFSLTDSYSRKFRYIYLHAYPYIYMQLHVCTHITQRCICTKYIHTHTYYIYIYYIRKLHSSLNITSSPTQPTWCPPCLTSSSCHWPHGACGTAECQESRHRDPRPGDGSTDGHLFASNTSSPAQRFGWEQPSFYWI